MPGALLLCAGGGERRYAHTLKPLLDVVLFTRSLARVMGYKCVCARRRR